MGGTRHAIFDTTCLADAFGRVMPESMEFARRHFPHLIGFFVTDQRLEEHLAPEARAARFHPLWDHLAGAMPERHGAGALENRVARLLRRRKLLQGKSASTNSPGWTRVSDNSL